MGDRFGEVAQSWGDDYGSAVPGPERDFEWQVAFLTVFEEEVPPSAEATVMGVPVDVLAYDVQ